MGASMGERHVGFGLDLAVRMDIGLTVHPVDKAFQAGGISGFGSLAQIERLGLSDRPILEFVR